MDPKMAHAQDASTNQIWNSYLKEYMRYAPDKIILETKACQCHSNPKMVRYTPPSEDASTHQIWYFCFKQDSSLKDS